LGDKENDRNSAKYIANFTANKNMVLTTAKYLPTALDLNLLKPTGYVMHQQV
jgi:hypothetical protein